MDPGVLGAVDWATEGLPEGLPGVTLGPSVVEASVSESVVATEGLPEVTVVAPVVRARVVRFSKLGLTLRNPRVAEGFAVVESPLLGGPLDGATEGLPGITVGVPVVVVGAWVLVLASGVPRVSVRPTLGGATVGDVVEDGPAELP